MNLRDFWTDWHNFWFKPQSSLPVALFRICFGLIFLTQILTQYWHDFPVFFGSHPILTHANYVAYWQYKDFLINIFDFLPISTAWHIGVFVVILLSTIFMTVGLFTRVSTFITFILFTSISNQFPFLCNAGDDMQRLVLFLLLFTRAGDALSIDCLREQPKENWYQAFFVPPLSAPWGQRMLQLQISIAYISTALLKINSDIWFSGNGLNYASRLVDFGKFTIPFVLDHRFSLYLLNWLTLVVEFSLGTLVWISEFTNWILLAGVIFQLTIDWTMNIPIFEFVFISMYILFIKPEDLFKLIDWFKLLFLYSRTRLKQSAPNKDVHE